MATTLMKTFQANARLRYRFTSRRKLTTARRPKFLGSLVCLLIFFGASAQDEKTASIYLFGETDNKYDSCLCNLSTNFYIYRQEDGYQHLYLQSFCRREERTLLDTSYVSDGILITPRKVIQNHQFEKSFRLSRRKRTIYLELYDRSHLVGTRFEFASLKRKLSSNGTLFVDGSRKFGSHTVHVLDRKATFRLLDRHVRCFVVEETIDYGYYRETCIIYLRKSDLQVLSIQRESRWLSSPSSVLAKASKVVAIMQIEATNSGFQFISLPGPFRLEVK